MGVHVLIKSEITTEHPKMIIKFDLKTLMKVSADAVIDILVPADYIVNIIMYER